MLNLSKEKLTEAVNTIQRKLCAYDGLLYRDYAPPSCDCKYGISADSKSHGEDTGCPELRDVKVLLDAMTDKEYDKLVSRVEKQINKNMKVVLASFLNKPFSKKQSEDVVDKILTRKEKL